MKHRITPVFGIALVAAMASSSMTRLAQAAPYVEIRPVEPLGTGAAPYPAGTTIDGNTITVPAGTRVWFDVYIGGWAPAALETFSTSIPDGALANGQGTPLQYVLETCPAADSASPYCAGLFGVGCACRDDPEDLYCNRSFLDLSRTLITTPLIAGSSFPTSNPLTFGFTTFPPYVPDGGDAYLVQSFVLDVPSDAAGTYAIGAAQDPSTYFTTSGGNPPVETYTPAVVNVLSPCCLPGGACMEMEDYMCANAGGTVSDHCWGDCNMDGIDDGCQGVADCNNNGMGDTCDISAGTSTDLNEDGIPDECSGVIASIKPVAPLGTGAAPYPAGTAIDGNHITIPSGSRVWLDVYIGGWGSDPAKTLALTFDPATLASGAGAPLVLPDVACSTSSDPTCESEFGVNSHCLSSPTSHCSAVFLDPARSELPNLILGMGDTPLLRAGWTGVGTVVPDVGVLYLTGSLVLDVPTDAYGTYTIDLLYDSDTFLTTDSGSVFDASQFDVAPATITVVRSGPCCLPGGACMEMEDYMCLDAGGTSTDQCYGDCDGDGIDEGCEAFDDCDGNNVPDACELQTNDCNHNGVVDACDVAAGADDCNADNIPDVCELGPNDCDGNGIPDDCQNQDDCDGNGVPDLCEFAAGNAADCNDNGVLDACDIDAGTSTDANGDCIPDECDAMAGPVAEVNGHPENRFLSFSTAGAGCREAAVRVELVSLSPPGRGNDFAAFDGKWRWLGPPVMHTFMMNDGPEYDMMSPLQCDPYFQDWSTVGMVHVYGAEVMPESTYAVSFFDASCGDVNNPSCYSNELVVHTAKWADLAPPYDGETAAVEPDIADVAALVDKFLGNSWPTRPEADLHPNILNVDGPIDFNDISTAVDAYLGQPYPFAGPVACPSD